VKVATTPKSTVTKLIITFFTWFSYVYISWYVVAFNVGGKDNWMASLSKNSPYSFVVDKAYGNHYSYDGNNLNSCKYISLPPLEPLPWSLLYVICITSLCSIYFSYFLQMIKSSRLFLLMTLFKT
jgi:hypothetical protein